MATGRENERPVGVLPPVTSSASVLRWDLTTRRLDGELVFRYQLFDAGPGSLLVLHEPIVHAYLIHQCGGSIMTEQPVRDQHPRLRQRPSERFAGDSHVVDLGVALRDLRAEAPATHRGHRQITLLKQRSMTQVLFSFDPSSVLQDHITHGLVTIHVLEGHLTVHAAGHAHALSAGYVLVLNPDVAHDVCAADTSAMLLTVQLNGTHDER